MKTANLLFALLFFFIPIGLWAIVLTDDGPKKIEALLFMGLMTLVSLVVSGIFAYAYINGDLEIKNNKAGVWIVLVLLLASCGNASPKHDIWSKEDQIRETINYLAINYPESFKSNTGFVSITIVKGIKYEICSITGKQYVTTSNYDQMIAIFDQLTKQDIKAVILKENNSSWLITYDDRIFVPIIIPLLENKEPSLKQEVFEFNSN